MSRESKNEAAKSDLLKIIIARLTTIETSTLALSRERSGMWELLALLGIEELQRSMSNADTAETKNSMIQMGRHRDMCDVNDTAQELIGIRELIAILKKNLAALGPVQPKVGKVAAPRMIGWHLN